MISKKAVTYCVRPVTASFACVYCYEHQSSESIANSRIENTTTNHAWQCHSVSVSVFQEQCDRVSTSQNQSRSTSILTRNIEFSYNTEHNKRQSQNQTIIVNQTWRAFASECESQRSIITKTPSNHYVQRMSRVIAYQGWYQYHGTWPMRP